MKTVGELDSKFQDSPLLGGPPRKLEHSKSKGNNTPIPIAEEEDVCPICLEGELNQAPIFCIIFLFTYQFLWTWIKSTVHVWHCICYVEYDSTHPEIITKCKHHFHLACLLEWTERSDACPICDKVCSNKLRAWISNSSFDLFNIQKTSYFCSLTAYDLHLMLVTDIWSSIVCYLHCHRWRFSVFFIENALPDGLWFVLTCKTDQHFCLFFDTGDDIWATLSLQKWGTLSSHWIWSLSSVHHWWMVLFLVQLQVHFQNYGCIDTLVVS